MAAREKNDEMISGLSPSLKKELLNELVASLLKEVSEEDKKQVLQAVLSSKKGSGQVIDMVEH